MAIDRNIQIIKDLDGKNIVVINSLIFKGKKRVDWKIVKEYLKKYVGEFYQIIETGDIIFIGNDLPNEYTRSKYTRNLVRSNIKNKANLAQAIPELIEIASNKKQGIIQKNKHKNDAIYGWYKYDTRFAFPVFNDNKQIIRYNVYKAILLMRKSSNNNLYLYDIIQIFKEK